MVERIKRLTLRTKILLPIVVQTVLLLFLALYLFVYLRHTEQELRQSIEAAQVLNDYSTKILILHSEIQTGILYYQLNGQEQYKNEALLKQRLVAEYVDEMGSYVRSPTGKELLLLFEQTREPINEAREDLFRSIEENSESEIFRNYNRYQILKENIDTASLDFTNYNLSSLRENTQRYENLLIRFSQVFLIFITLTLLLVLSFYYYLKLFITDPIILLTSAAKQISRGKFGSRFTVDSEDELGMLSQSLHDMSKQLKKYYLSLEQKVSQKEKELEENKEFEKRKDNFINVASHELKTPVTSLKIFTQLLGQEARKTDNEVFVKYLGKMDEQIRKLTELISSLLDITKMQSGKLSLEKKEFDINKTVKESVDVMQDFSPIHSILVKGKATQRVLADEDRIKQVIDNLISNAIKYSPNGGNIVVGIDNTKEYVKVSVTDSGIGIPKEHQKKIFERFYRVSKGDERTFSGLGIGLYIVYEIVTRHKGKLSVVSQIDKGSTFSFTLPHSGKKRKK